MSEQDNSETTPAPGSWDPHAGAPDADVAGLRQNSDFMAALSNPMAPDHAAAQARWDQAHATAHSAEKAAEQAAEEVEQSAKPAGDYQINMPPGEEPDVEMAEFGRELAATAQLNQAELDGIVEIWNTANARAASGGNPWNSEDATEFLKAQHGPAQAAAMIETVQNYMDELPDNIRERARELLTASGAGNDPALIQHIAGIASRKAGA